ncbi:MAG TPA: glycosyltransferase, partial [Novosphingobium sp.]
HRLPRAWHALRRRCYLDSRLPRRYRDSYREQLRGRFDLVFAFKLQSALWLDSVLPPAERPAVRVVDFDDIESRMFANTVVTVPGHSRFWAWQLRRHLAWLRRTERSLMAGWTASTLCSDLDSGRLSEGVADAPSPWIVPNAYEFAAPLPQQDKVPLDLLFLGTFSYQPNIDAARWFVAEAWPRVRAVLGDRVQLTLAGFSPPPAIAELGQLDGVRVIANAPEVGALYDRAGIVIAPILAGSGTRIKLIEAAAYGRAIVTTSLGCEGLDFIDGVHAEIADDAAGFADRIVDLAGAPERRAALAQRAYAHARDRFDTDLIEQALAERLVSAAGQSASTPPRRHDASPGRRPLNVLFVTGDAHLPQALGGTQSSTDELARRLRGRGNRAGVFCALHPGGMLEWRARLQMKLRRRRIAIDHQLGYPVMRSWHPHQQVREVVELFRPDVAVVQNWHAIEIAKAFEGLGVPSVIYFRSVEFDMLGGNPASLQRGRFIANSRYTAAAYHLEFGIDCHIIRPTLDRLRYQCDGSGDKVLFINPVEKKGLDLAIEIARACPDLPFLFVESWTLEPEEYAALLARLADLPNVELRRKTADMRPIYAAARILLAPSKWQEAWGRVASEAQVSGIPVIGSNRGGLPEAIGPGGLVLDYDAPLADWVVAVRSVWGNQALWQSLSEAASAYSRRPELDAERQLDDFIAVLHGHVLRGFDPQAEA